MKFAIARRLAAGLVCLVAMQCLACVAWAGQKVVTLNGQDLTIEQVVEIAEGRADVAIDPAALDLCAKSHELLMAFAAEGRPVYGLTVGVGLNKDKAIFHTAADGRKTLTPEVMDLSRQFNVNALRAHSAGVGPDMEPEMVRATMVIRLNTLLSGRTGAQVHVAELYRDFLNKGVTPVVPSRGTVGECDITLAPHIGLVMMGEWQADYKGKRISGADALKKAGLKRLDAFGKDALSILSTNAPAMAKTVFAVSDAERFLSVATTVFGLSLEGLNGNVAPFIQPVNDVRPFTCFAAASKAVRAELEGSYLWTPMDGRALQDPLSYRTTTYTLGAAMEALADVKTKLAVQLNSSDDNPAVVVDVVPAKDTPAQLAKYYLDAGYVKGAIFPTSNFEPLPVVLKAQNLSVALAHVSRNAVMRTLRLSDPHFTHLSRFLAADDVAINFGAIAKPYVSLDADVRELANPVSIDTVPVAGDIEDTATNSMRVADRLSRIVDNLYYIYGLELFHAAQAVDLRQRDAAIELGHGTGEMYKAYRKVVSFVDKDRPFTPDIAKSHDFLKGYAIR
ncbi:histidine ammonia-lyase [Desulfobaculum xiamenense]|uniref:Histidine ammonia-lyase n=1 Tax=Desulfobaculum xiamenense TaxID=995050 RepID=A0A846QSD0_9BACT|nr:aromatic amino acid ammonia-lyase [Desulfobaculum xiamenense]NJB68345.1 histidine ammonia-lyase [Desulfobaculum xiamenense]